MKILCINVLLHCYYHRFHDRFCVVFVGFLFFLCFYYQTLKDSGLGNLENNTRELLLRRCCRFEFTTTLQVALIFIGTNCFLKRQSWPANTPPLPPVPTNLHGVTSLRRERGTTAQSVTFGAWRARRRRRRLKELLECI